MTESTIDFPAGIEIEGEFKADYDQVLTVSYTHLTLPTSDLV